LLKSAVSLQSTGKPLVTSEQRDAINEIERVRDSHAHPVGFLNSRSLGRLASIRKRFGVEASFPPEIQEIIAEGNEESSWNVRSTGSLQPVER
jgi:hypothetical protein